MDQCVGKVPPRMANPDSTRGSLVGPAHQKVCIQATVHKYPTILPSVVPSGYPSTGRDSHDRFLDLDRKRLPMKKLQSPVSLPLARVEP
jgi:hypothetical protein